MNAPTSLPENLQEQGARANSTVTIVIPALNEEDGIGKTLSQVPIEQLKALDYGLQIIVIDGNSDDDTRRIAKDLGAEVLIEPRKGYGRAYKTGFSHVKGDFVVTLDADASYPASEIPRLVGIVRSNKLDFLSTNRFAFMADGAMSSIKRLGNKLLSLLVFALFSIRLFDSQSGMWVCRTKALLDIIPNSDGMPFSEEIKIRAFRRLNAAEAPVPYKRRIGRVKLRIFRDGLANILHLFRLRIHLSMEN